MLDTGCQGNFVSKKLMIRKNFQPVTKDINLTINGFNSSKNCVTDIVEVP